MSSLSEGVWSGGARVLWSDGGVGNEEGLSHRGVPAPTICLRMTLWHLSPCAGHTVCRLCEFVVNRVSCVGRVVFMTCGRNCGHVVWWTHAVCGLHKQLMCAAGVCACTGREETRPRQGVPAPTH
jgi:hypothetical protein